jgi:hypothetical protein
MRNLEMGDFHLSSNPFTLNGYKGNAFRVDVQDITPETKVKLLNLIKQEETLISENKDFVRFFTQAVHVKDMKNLEQSSRTREILKSFIVEDYVYNFLKQMKK